MYANFELIAHVPFPSLLALRRVVGGVKFAAEAVGCLQGV
jgi:hypothetical protein